VCTEKINHDKQNVCTGPTNARTQYPLSISYVPTPHAQDLMWYFTKSYWNCHNLLWNNTWWCIFLMSNSHVKV